MKWFILLFLSLAAKSLCRELMTVDPEKRITLSDAINHAWFKDEAVRSKAQRIMFPDSGGMAPPTALVRQWFFTFMFKSGRG